MKKIVFNLFLILNLGIISGQETSVVPMITDRPDATESPTTVPLRSLQIETGGAYQSFKEGIIDEQITYNTTLLRYGLLENLELRIGIDFNKIKRINNSESISGTSPLLLGVKIPIAEEKGLLPEIGFLGHLSLPFTANKNFKPETTGVDFRFSFAHTLSKKSSLSYNLGAQWSDDSPQAAYIYTLSYGVSLSKKIGFYAELYGDFPEDDRANHLWDSGFTYLVKPNIQFDITLGTGINTNQNLLVSAGISVRIPK